MAEFNRQFLERTIQVWQLYSPAPLSLEDAKEIAENMTELFKCLMKLDEKYKEKEKKEI